MEWKEVDIEQTSIEIIDGDRGKNYPKNNELTNSGYCLFLSAANVTKNGLQFSNNSFITKEKDALLRKGKLMPKDIVLTTRGTVGNVGFYSDDVPYPNMRINSGMVIIRPGEDFDTMFLYQYLRSCYFRAQITQFQSGSAQPQLPISTLQKMKVIKPDIDAQRRIASILSSLDRKIELNNKINADLEEMAQAIFKNWFVDFEPFKDGKFVDSELGMIPEGWKVGSPYEYVKVVYGAPYKSAKFNDNGEGLPLIRIRDLKDCNPQFYTPEILPQTEYVNMGDIVAGMDAEFVPHIWKGNTGLLNQRVCKLMPQQTSISNLFVLYLMKPELEFVQSYKTGTTVSHLGKADIDKFVVVLPPLKVVEECSKILDSILQRIKNISAESRNLSTLRDTLLPRLMSGELEVPE